MESSSTSGNSSEPPRYGWAELIGNIIAITTFAVPLIAVAHFSDTPELQSPVSSTHTTLQSSLQPPVLKQFMK